MREVVEAAERVTPEGEVLQPLDEARLAADLARLRARGIESVAIVFMHGYRHPRTKAARRRSRGQRDSAR